MLTAEPNLHPLRNLLLAILSGVLLTFAFPPGHVSFVAWFALVPLLISTETASPLRALRLGLISGLAHYLTLIYWIIVVLERYGNLHILVALFSLLLLSLYLSFYLALFSCLTSCIKGSRFSLVLMACFWVALEYLKSNLLTGFPWCLLGYTQYKQLYLIQTADLFGVYGISFLIVFANGLIFRILARDRRQTYTSLKWELPVLVLLLAGALIYGHYHVSGSRTDKKAGQSVNTAIVQANIDQSVKWDPAYQEETIRTYQRLTRSARSFKPQLIVWPETSLPFFFQDSLRFSPEMFSLAEESGAILIFGSPAYKRIQGAIRYYNRAYMIAPDAQQVKYYDKMHLVPFGEYVPLKKYLPFINRLVTAAGDFATGEKLTPLNTGDLSLGTLICFEAIFPELARTLAREGANIFVNITNDAWFGMTSAPYQHLSMAVFRAVENRRPMVRAANTGFSAFIEPTGAIRSQSHLLTEQVLEGSVTPGTSPLTFYSRYGDLFAIALLIISFARILSCLWVRQRQR
ncbi:MAG: apolipoprotein N-acyltransferase [Proteobacteria bacterium]|nr:apolipoprotein N-acyltransferase [Desulfobacterales bacterium]MBL7101358.1 apolipoprotein N-acyltransferase [Desulfobacteraceae bacterium]MBU0733360.1 apolipoprotein N-acyltransferase [Pseudomonadota bacterium]MBU1902564.1 apolipoprotein N-acyltransferase [Pseudomonadota bacterium]